MSGTEHDPSAVVWIEPHQTKSNKLKLDKPIVFRCFVDPFQYAVILLAEAIDPCSGHTYRPMLRSMPQTQTAALLAYASRPY